MPARHPGSFSHLHSITLTPTSAILSSWFSKYIQNLLHIFMSIITTILLLVITIFHIHYFNVSSSLTASTLSSILKTKTILNTATKPNVFFRIGYAILSLFCSHLYNGFAAHQNEVFILPYTYPCGRSLSVLIIYLICHHFLLHSLSCNQAGALFLKGCSHFRAWNSFPDIRRVHSFTSVRSLLKCQILKGHIPLLWFKIATNPYHNIYLLI